MLRTSSPAWYSRTSENSMPCPLNTERYSPVKSEFTSPRVRSSRSLTWRSTSGGTAAAGCIATAVGRGCLSRGSRPFVEAFLRRKSVNAIPPSPLPIPPESWRFDLRKHPLHDLIARHFFRLGFVCRQHTVAKHVRRDRF